MGIRQVVRGEADHTVNRWMQSGYDIAGVEADAAAGQVDLRLPLVRRSPLTWMLRGRHS